MRGFKTVRSNMPALIDERKSFHYTITTTENKNNDASFLGALKKIVNIYFFYAQTLAFVYYDASASVIYMYKLKNVGAYFKCHWIYNIFAFLIFLKSVIILPSIYIYLKHT